MKGLESVEDFGAILGIYLTRVEYAGSLLLKRLWHECSTPNKG